MNAAGPWIPVSERLPELLPPQSKRPVWWSARVLAWGPDISTIAQRYRIDDGSPVVGWTNDYGEELGERVTHWAVLVAPEVSR